MFYIDIKHKKTFNQLTCIRKSSFYHTAVVDNKTNIFRLLACQFVLVTHVQ